MPMTEPRQERRSGSVEPNQVGSMNQGLARIENEVMQVFSAHDAECQKLDPTKWFTPYSLLYHHVRVRDVMVKIAGARGRRERETLIGRFAALLHDTGKLDKEMLIYRIPGRLSDEERVIMNKHSELSGKYIEACLRKVRREDSSLMALIHLVATFHHKPYKISDPGLRAIGYDLKFADIFVALQEDRAERPGLDISGALEALEQIDICREDPMHAYHLPLIYQSKRVIMCLFGLDLRPDA